VARLANISGKDAVKAFQKAGWVVIGQVGSHVVMSKPGIRVNLSVPQDRELSVGNASSPDPPRRNDRGGISGSALNPVACPLSDLEFAGCAGL
jgi:predicted RNA binding protein YcfA (HicA-like mRNA interferase family)